MKKVLTTLVMFGFGMVGACGGEVTAEESGPVAKKVEYSNMWLWLGAQAGYNGDPGQGTVTSNISGIGCSTEFCRFSVAQGTQITLTAHPQNGVLLRTWTGVPYYGDSNCGPNLTCTFTVTAPIEVDALFGCVSGDAGDCGCNQEVCCAGDACDGANALSCNYDLGFGVCQ